MSVEVSAEPRGYLGVLRTPRVASIVAAQLTARFPFGMLSLALLIHAEQIFGSFAAAGLVLATMSAGQAVAGPCSSRCMGRLGIRPVLLGTAVVGAAAMTVMALVPVPLAVMAVLSLITGLATPPVQPAVRTIYPTLVNPRQLLLLFAVDTSVQEIIWLGGPVIATLIALNFGTAAGLLASATLLIIGVVWFIAIPEVGQVTIPRNTRRLGSVLRMPAVIISAAVGFLVVAAYSSVEVGVIAVFGHGSALAGYALGIFAAGSLVGGLALGHRKVGPWSLACRMLVITGGLLLAAFNQSFWWLAITLLIAGVGSAPVYSVLFRIVSHTVALDEAPEAFGWAATGQLVGAAAGSAVAGLIVDGNGPASAMLLAAGFAGVGAIVAVCARRHAFI